VPSDLPPSPFEGVHVSHGAGDDRSLSRAAEAGVLRRVRQGAYVDEALWQRADRLRRTLLRLQAVSASRGFRDVLSHQSAAALHGLSLLREPDDVHATDPSIRSTRSRAGLVIHSAPLAAGDIDVMPPFRLTPMLRTLGDLLLHLPFVEGVAAADAALWGGLVTVSGVRSRIESLPRTRGRATGLRALDFAQPGAANPGESLSRVLIMQSGFGQPILQEPFRDRDGRIGFVDFWWPQAGVIGEFDGFVKYSYPEYLRGRSPSQVVVDEKTRERRLEALPGVRRVVRWVWSDLQTPERFFRILSAGGVPRA
jgi:hypothetical protein